MPKCLTVKKMRWLLIVFFGFHSWSYAFAYLVCTVRSDAVKVMAQPLETSKVVETLSKGQKVSADPNAQHGFYYVRTLNGSLGWVSQQELTVINVKDPSRSLSSQGSL